MANVEQAEYWDGEAGGFWVAQQARHDRMLEDYGLAALDAAGLDAGHDVLDVGCGTGALTREAARRASAGSVLGVDLSQAMLQRARQLAIEDGLDHCRFEQADAQISSFAPASVDRVVSRFGVMFFNDPVAAFANIRAAMRPSGRMAFVCWQEMSRNDWQWVPVDAAVSVVGAPEPVDPAAPGPYAFADAGRVRNVLGDAGFVDVEVAEHRAPVQVGVDLDDAVEFLHTSRVIRRLLADRSDEVRAAVVRAMHEALSPFAGAHGVVLDGAAWVVTAAQVVDEVV